MLGHLLLFVHVEVWMGSLQRFVDRFQLPWFRQQHPRRAIIHQVEGQVFEGEPRDLPQDDLFHLVLAVHRGHAVVCCDDDVQSVAQPVLFSRVADVAHRSVHLLDHPPALWGVGAVQVACAVRLPEVKGYEVQIIVSKPSHHLVCVLSPSRLIPVVVTQWLHFPYGGNLSLVTGRCARKVKRASFQTLEGKQKRCMFTGTQQIHITPQTLI